MHAFEDGGDLSDANNQAGRIVANMFVDAEVTLRYPEGRNVSIGKAEFHDTFFSTFINQTNLTTLSTWLHSCNVSEMWLDTTYMGRYRSSPYAINMATRTLAGYFNRNYLNNMAINLQNLTFGIFEVKDPHLGYYDGYLGLGLTADWRKTSLFNGTDIFDRISEKTLLGGAITSLVNYLFRKEKLV